jgi:hypothetical protein
VGLPYKGGDNNTIDAAEHRILRFKFDCGGTTSCVHAYGKPAKMKTTAYTGKVLVATSKMGGNGRHAWFGLMRRLCMLIFHLHAHMLAMRVVDMCMFLFEFVAIP